MNSEQIKVWLAGAWEGRVSDMYKGGWIANRQMLLAAMFHAMNSPEMPGFRVWLSESIAFPPMKAEDYLDWENYHKKQELQGKRADLLVTDKDELRAVLLLNFAPDGYGDFREDMAFLECLHHLRGAGDILLKKNPHTGKIKVDEVYPIHEELLLVYAVVNQEASMSLEIKTLKEQVRDPLFWYYFYSLQGKIGAFKIKFKGREGLR